MEVGDPFTLLQSEKIDCNAVAATPYDKCYIGDGCWWDRTNTEQRTCAGGTYFNCELFTGCSWKAEQGSCSVYESLSKCQTLGALESCSAEDMSTSYSWSSGWTTEGSCKGTRSPKAPIAGTATIPGVCEGTYAASKPVCKHWQCTNAGKDGMAYVNNGKFTASVASSFAFGGIASTIATVVWQPPDGMKSAFSLNDEYTFNKAASTNTDGLQATFDMPNPLGSVCLKFSGGKVIQCPTTVESTSTSQMRVVAYASHTALL